MHALRAHSSLGLRGGARRLQGIRGAEAVGRAGDGKEALDTEMTLLHAQLTRLKGV